MGANQKHFCTCCDRELNPTSLVWLELVATTGRYQADGTVPASRSQGSFPFGSGCAAKVLKNGGRCARRPRR